MAYKNATESQYLQSQFSSIDEYRANLVDTAQNNPSKLTFSNLTYEIGGKFQNPNVTQPQEKLEQINVLTELYEAAKVDQRKSCDNLEDQIVENLDQCKTGYNVIDRSTINTDMFMGEPTCIIITKVTDVGWYRDRYRNQAQSQEPDDVCLRAYENIEQYLNYYNNVYDVNLESSSVREDSPEINRVLDSIDVLKNYVQVAYDRIQSDYDEKMQTIATDLEKMHHVNVYDDLNCTDVFVAYKNFKEPLCELQQNGFIEILVLGFLGIPLEVCLLWLGITFVLRNKVDVPKYEPPKHKGKSKKNKAKKSKQSSAINSDQDQESAVDDSSMVDSDDEDMIEEVDSVEEDEQGRTGCCGCCGSKTSSRKAKNKNERKIG